MHAGRDQGRESMGTAFPQRKKDWERRFMRSDRETDPLRVICMNELRLTVFAEHRLVI